MSTKNRMKNVEGIIKTAYKKHKVRTTFNLSQDAHKFIKDFAKFSSKNASEIIDVLLDCYNDLSNKDKKEMESSFQENENKNRKTYVVDSTTLKRFKTIATKDKVSRDLIIEKSFFYFQPIFEEAKKKSKKAENLASEKASEAWDCIEGFQREIESLLELDHPITRRMSLIATELMALNQDIEHYLKTGEPIDSY